MFFASYTFKITYFYNTVNKITEFRLFFMCYNSIIYYHLWYFFIFCDIEYIEFLTFL